MRLNALKHIRDGLGDGVVEQTRNLYMNLTLIWCFYPLFLYISYVGGGGINLTFYENNRKSNKIREKRQTGLSKGFLENAIHKKD